MIPAQPQLERFDLADGAAGSSNGSGGPAVSSDERVRRVLAGGERSAAEVAQLIGLREHATRDALRRVGAVYRRTGRCVLYRLPGGPAADLSDLTFSGVEAERERAAKANGAGLAADVAVGFLPAGCGCDRPWPFRDDEDEDGRCLRCGRWLA